MSGFVNATLAKRPRVRQARQVACFYAAILVIFVLAQLFTFDEFTILLTEFNFPGGAPFAQLVAVVIVVSEVFALPFLLELSLSPLMRIVSMILGWAVPIIWIKLAFWLIFSATTVTNIGYFGTVISLIPGWWAVFFGIALGILAGWSSWGLWPFAIHHKHKLE